MPFKDEYLWAQIQKEQPPIAGAKAKAWCLLIHADAFLSQCYGAHRGATAPIVAVGARTTLLYSITHGGQGESPVPPHTR